MTGADAEVLARMRLVQGRSVSELREFVRLRGQTQLLTVGRDAECDWCVQEAGVAPVHFSLHWDGNNLRIADTHGAGNVRVDGVLVGADWRRLIGRSRIDFGRAVIAVEAQGNADEPESWGRARTPGGREGQAFSSRRPTQMQDFAVQVAGSVKVSGSEPPTSERVTKNTVLEASAFHPEVQLTSAPATQIVLHRKGDSDRAQRYGGEQTSYELDNAREEPGFALPSGGRIPQAVVVLSPVSGVTQPPVISERPSYRVRYEKPLPSWNRVVIGAVVVIAGYFSWLYLLYHL